MHDHESKVLEARSRSSTFANTIDDFSVYAGHLTMLFTIFAAFDVSQWCSEGVGSITKNLFIDCINFIILNTYVKMTILYSSIYSLAEPQ